MHKSIFLFAALMIVTFGCTQKQTTMDHKYTNDLINETSPYLLQHAHNPVNWKAWSPTTLEEAKKENKLLLISVGYSACHWCHVMEHESFEDSLVAVTMNSKFINVKVDREERPDVDQVYMNAVQLMTGSGGWPLNVIALPDGRPVWGGTYFRKTQWIETLEKIAELYQREPETLKEYASKLEEGMTQMDMVVSNSNAPEFKEEFAQNAINNWSKQFDTKKGGLNSAPKFMMPNNYHYLLRSAYQNKDQDLMTYVETTLKNIAYGGVYDHIGGGFSRYSVDAKWHVPHFEKMLYDNAQLVSLYADAYQITKNPLYKTVVEETLEFTKRELTNSDGTFYSALDADSKTPEGELEEGAFYVWTKDELKTLLGGDYDLFSDYYNINNYGLWEHGNYVLIRKDSNKDIVEKFKITEIVLEEKLKNWKTLLLTEREKRARPRLDDKILTSWNALMLKAYVDAYRVFSNDTYLQTAITNATFIINKQIQPDGGLNHTYKNGKSTINGYLEDYAATIEAFISLYEVTFDTKWLNTARDLTNYCFDNFYNSKNAMFYFTSNKDASLVSRTIEYRDNVIPASNSIMANNLFKLSHYFDNEQYLKTATSMLNNVKPEIEQYASAYSNWLNLMLNYTNNYYEVAIVGKDAKSKLKSLNTSYIPNALFIGSKVESSLPLLKNRYVDDETFIYVCVNKACKLPVTEAKEAIKLIND